MKPTRFATSADPLAPEKFREWQRDNPHGYFINAKTSSSGMLHQVNCWHVGRPDTYDPEFGDWTKNPKYCHRSSHVLRNWAQAIGMELDSCADCLHGGE